MNNQNFKIIKNSLAKYYFNSSSGITLIALVITIIVLLILAGVSISLVVGENGILTQATTAVVANEIAQEKEQIYMSYTGEKTDVLIGKKQVVTAEDLEIAMNNAYGEGTVTVREGEDSLIVRYIVSEREYIISNDGKVVAVPIAEKVQPTNVDDWIYSVDEETGMATITGYKGTGGEIVVPNYIGDYPVKSIRGSFGEGIIRCWAEGIWFYSICNKMGLACSEILYYNTSVTKVTISEGIENIDDFSFGQGQGIKEVIIPRSVTNIGYWAFEGCLNLATVNYTGTEEEWNNIKISEHEELDNATINYNYGE